MPTPCLLSSTVKVRAQASIALAPDGGLQLVQEVGVGRIRGGLPCVQDLVVGTLHEPLLQLRGLGHVRALLHLHAECPHLCKGSIYVDVSRFAESPTTSASRVLTLSMVHVLTGGAERHNGKQS